MHLSSNRILQLRPKGLSEYWIELLDMLLQTNYITIQGKHVVYTLVLKALNVNVLVLFQLDQVSDLMVFVHTSQCLLILITHVEGIES